MMIDFEALTDEQRLDLIQMVLGLLPSPNTLEGRSVYLAFQIAQRSNAEVVEDALARLEDASPGWFYDRVMPFAKDIKGVQFPRIPPCDPADLEKKRVG